MSLDDVLTKFTLYAPADEAAIEAAQSKLGLRFPADYIEFLRRSNGAMSNNEPGFVVLHPVEDIAASDGRVGIGYNGGSYYFDIDVGCEPPAYMAIPTVAEDDVTLGTTLEEMLHRGLAGLVGQPPPLA